MSDETEFMTPSRWHDDARNRDAGHDEMQVRVMRECLDGRLPFELDLSEKQSDLLLANVYAEYPLFNMRRSPARRIRGFVDVAILWCPVNAELDGAIRRVANARDHFTFLELKPRISSAGALVRQCTAIVESASDYQGEVVPVVYVDDPKLPLLEFMWDGPIWRLPRDPSP